MAVQKNLYPFSFLSSTNIWEYLMCTASVMLEAGNIKDKNLCPHRVSPRVEEIDNNKNTLNILHVGQW